MDRRRLLTLAAATATLPACAPGAEGVLKVGSQKGGTKALLVASGVLEGAPYRVEWSEFPAAQHLQEAIGAGAVDLGAVGDAPFLFAYASGGKVRAVHASRSAGGGSGTAVLVPAASGLKSAADLKGRKVATGRGSIGHYLVLRLIGQAGLKPGDVTFVFLSPGDAKAAFATGAVDAWATWGSYIPLAVRDGARVLADGRGLLSGYGFEVANPGAIATKRPQILDFLTRLSKAQRWGAANRDAYAQALARETGLDLDIAAQTLSTARGEPVPIDARLIAEERQVLAVFQAVGAIGPNVDLTAAFDPSFAAAVAA